MKKRLLDFIPMISNRTKVLISMGLLILAMVMCVVRSESMSSKICVGAMLCSFIGDIVLNCTPLEKRAHSLLYIGATFFMFAHIIYAIAYYSLIQQLHFSYFNEGAFGAIVIMVVLFEMAIICIRMTHVKLKPIMICVFLIYMVVVSVNFVTIYSYSCSTGAISLIGASLFLISDYIIGIENVFGIKSEVLRKLVWMTYPVGQAIIIVCR